jgi:hypothetical protein
MVMPKGGSAASAVSTTSSANQVRVLARTSFQLVVVALTRSSK